MNDIIKEPWVKWSGGNCPPEHLNEQSLVKVKFSTGKTAISKAWWINWNHFAKGILHKGNVVEYYELDEQFLPKTAVKDYIQ